MGTRIGYGYRFRRGDRLKMTSRCGRIFCSLHPVTTSQTIEVRS